jgi:hypothetical protein
MLDFFPPLFSECDTMETRFPETYFSVITLLYTCFVIVIIIVIFVIRLTISFHFVDMLSSSSLTTNSNYNNKNNQKKILRRSRKQQIKHAAYFCLGCHIYDMTSQKKKLNLPQKYDVYCMLFFFFVVDFP